MRTRRVILCLGILAVVAVGGFAAYRSPWMRALLARDSENPDELTRLKNNPLGVDPVADASAGWPNWRGPTRDGRAPAGDIRTDWDAAKPKLLWKANCRSGFSSCSVVGGRLYTLDVADGQERVFCLDAEKGTLIWEYRYPVSYAGMDSGQPSGPRATPTVIGNRVYAVGGAGKLLCLEAPSETGGQPRVVWQHELIHEFGGALEQWGVAGSPLVEGDLVIVQPGGPTGAVVAFDRESGQLRWKAGENPAGYSSPVAMTVGGRRVILALTGDALLAVGTDGGVHDKYDWKTQYKGNISTPLVVADYVFISSAYGMGCALLRVDPRADGVRLIEVYARRGRAYQSHHCTSVFKDRYLYGFDGQSSARLKCISIDTGKEKDEWEGQGIDKGTLILAGDHLVIQTERGDLCLVEATAEEFRLVVKIPRLLSGRNNWATPTLAGGRLYLRDDEKVVCYDVRK
jgi:outer membrane protein assembly factor BamB